MIASLSGKLISKSPQSALVDVHGVGYEVFVSLNTFYQLPEPGENVALQTHLHVREDVHQLYGFRSPREKSAFVLLLGVSGVGPKLALSVLSGMTPDELAKAVAAGDVARLSSIPGIGRKIAERLALELKEKVATVLKSGYPEEPGAARRAEGSTADDIVSALVNLGYKKPQAQEAVRRVLAEDNGSAPMESLIKAALKILSR